MSGGTRETLTNFREGMRRIGLVVGGIGFFCGCLISARFVGDLKSQFDDAKEFRELASSQDVKDEVAKIKRRQSFRYEDNVRGAVGVIFWDEKEPPTDEQIEEVRHSGYKIKADEVRAVEFDDKGKEIRLFRKQDGTVATRSSFPTPGQYVFLLAPPLLGFAGLWGAVKCAMWIRAGFTPLSSDA